MQTMACEDGAERAVIHFALAEGLACSPRLTELHAGQSGAGPLLRSADPTAATCRLCRATGYWLTAMERNRQPTQEDEKVIHYAPDGLPACGETGKVFRSEDHRATTCKACRLNQRWKQDHLEGEDMRQIRLRVLPGEPLDGTGRIRIHWFRRDDKAKGKTPTGSVQSSVGSLKVGGVSGYIACDKNREPLTSKIVNGAYAMEPYSDDVRGATCPECLATPEYKAALREIEELIPAPAYPGQIGG